MCVVIDVNVIRSVFNSDAKKHEDFKPIRDWIFDGKGKIVYGGSRYLEEVGEKIIDVFLELGKYNKCAKVGNSTVDEEEQKISKQLEDKDFDDQHLVALLRTSGCRLICSLDERAYPFFTHNQFFKGKNKPKIYKSKKIRGF